MRNRRSPWRLLALAAIVVTGCDTAASDEDHGVGAMERVRDAVAHAQESGTYRVRGQLVANGAFLAWEGIVAGADEQYVMTTGGLRFESRRVADTGWRRRLDRPEPWKTFPYDGPIDLTVLLRGTPDGVEQADGRFTVTLQFVDVDVLRALTHAPSTGPTTAEVSLSGNAIRGITLHLAGGASAQLELWDHGAPLAVDPVTVSQLGAAGHSDASADDSTSPR
jgi:hypothetical protein